jgi:thiol-disulfide isomerase/thioredoxin
MKKLVLVFSFAFVSLGFAQGKIIKFKADITNRNSDVLTISNDNGVVKEIKGDTKGHFEASFEAKEGMYFLSDGVEYAQLYLKGGDDLQMKMDAKRFDETITFSGKGAAENNFLAGRTLQEQGFKYDSLLALDEKEFNQAVEAKSAKDLAVIDNSILHPTFKDLQKTGIMEQVKAMKQYYLEKKSKLKLNNTLSVSFDYENYKGGKSKLEDFKGKYVYIDVWATWCGPCVQEIPSLKKVEEKYHNKNIVFVSISIDDVKDFEKWKAYVKEKQLAGVQLFANIYGDDNFMKTYGVSSIPRFILIDPKGKIVSADTYRPSDPQLLQELDKYL